LPHSKTDDGSKGANLRLALSYTITGLLVHNIRVLSVALSHCVETISAKALVRTSRRCVCDKRVSRTRGKRYASEDHTCHSQPTQASRDTFWQTQKNMSDVQLTPSGDRRRSPRRLSPMQQGGREARRVKTIDAAARSYLEEEAASAACMTPRAKCEEPGFHVPGAPLRPRTLTRLSGIDCQPDCARRLDFDMECA
jgi:hypothetical protein